MSPEILAISNEPRRDRCQSDKLGKQGQRIWQAAKQEVWTRPLAA